MSNQPEDKLETELRTLVSEVNCARGAASRFKAQLQEAILLLEQAANPDPKWAERVSDLKRRVDILM